MAISMRKVIGFRARQLLTLALLPLGYSGYYYCRTVFYVIQPQLLEDIEVLGMDLEDLGLVAAGGAVAYAAGKLLTAPLIDFTGGRTMFVFGLVASVFATLTMGFSMGFAFMAGAWAASRLFQSIGWGSMLKLVSRWFSYRYYGQVMGLMSLSYLFGDALIRWHLGSLMLAGYGWRGLVLLAAALGATAAVLCWWGLRTAPPQELEPEVNPRNLYGETGSFPRPSDLLALMRPLIYHPAFWMMMLASLGLNIVRESFQQWSTIFLSDSGQISHGEATRLSAVFPLAGGVSALLFGYITDLLPRKSRSVLALSSLVLLAVVLFFMGMDFADLELSRFVWLMALSGLLLIGPYSLLAGAMALDVGARTGSSSTANLTDGIGYLGSLYAGYGVAVLVVRQGGWADLFPLLGLLSLVSAGALGVYGWVYERKR